jgi:hypothetical protein
MTVIPRADETELFIESNGGTGGVNDILSLEGSDSNVPVYQTIRGIDENLLVIFKMEKVKFPGRTSARVN